MSGASGYGTAASGRTWRFRVSGMHDQLQCLGVPPPQPAPLLLAQ